MRHCGWCDAGQQVTIPHQPNAYTLQQIPVSARIIVPTYLHVLVAARLVLGVTFAVLQGGTQVEVQKGSGRRVITTGFKGDRGVWDDSLLQLNRFVLFLPLFILLLLLVFLLLLLGLVVLLLVVIVVGVVAIMVVIAVMIVIVIVIAVMIVIAVVIVIVFMTIIIACVAVRQPPAKARNLRHTRGPHAP